MKTALRYITSLRLIKRTQNAIRLHKKSLHVLLNFHAGIQFCCRIKNNTGGP